MLLGDAVMLFHRKMRHYKKYRALTDTDPLVWVIITNCIILFFPNFGQENFDFTLTENFC